MKGKQFTSQEQQTLQSIMSHRRDVRGNRFTQQALSNESIEKIVQAGVLAPSVGFSQPWRFLVIRKAETKAKVAQHFELENQQAQAQFADEKQASYAALKLEGILEAPVNIAVYYMPPQEPVLGQTSMPEMGEYSVVCAVQNMWLMARSMNIGVGWVSILQPQSVDCIVGAPNAAKLVAYLCVGHVDEFYDYPELEALQWEQRKSLSSVLSYDEAPLKEGGVEPICSTPV